MVDQDGAQRHVQVSEQLSLVIILAPPAEVTAESAAAWAATVKKLQQRLSATAEAVLVEDDR